MERDNRTEIGNRDFRLEEARAMHYANREETMVEGLVTTRKLEAQQSAAPLPRAPQTGLSEGAR